MPCRAATASIPFLVYWAGFGLSGQDALSRQSLLTPPRQESDVLISRELADAFNAQIGHEFGASMQYVSIAAHFTQRQLKLLAKLFFEQADEERQHALKFVQYLLDTKGDLRIPAIPAPAPTFASAEDAVQAALTWEQEVTRQITALMDLAVKQNDYLAQSFLQWFIDEQLEEVVKMDRLLSVIRQSGERNLLMVEAYLIHIDKAS
jgi:ferritin